MVLGGDALTTSSLFTPEVPTHTFEPCGPSFRHFVLTRGVRAKGIPTPRLPCGLPLDPSGYVPPLWLLVKWKGYWLSPLVICSGRVAPLWLDSPINPYRSNRHTTGSPGAA